MTYNVFSGTLNRAQSEFYLRNQAVYFV